MATDRRFCRFNKKESLTLGKTESSGLSTREVPDDGLCLSSFLVIVQTDKINAVLMGRMNPGADWDHIGALDEARVKMNQYGWMLPSSHLMIYESPQDAAKRIAREQLDLPNLVLEAPIVVSEVYASRRFPDRKNHWDIEFIFRSTLGREEIRKPVAWNELRFVDLDETSKSEVVRSHEDIIESAGLRFGSD